MSDTESDYDDDEKDSVVKPVIIIDNGSDTIKAGFNGDIDGKEVNEVPQYEIPSIVGRPRYQSVMPGMAQQDVYVGDAVSRRSMSRLTRPFENGIITNWEDMEKLWHRIFYDKLGVEPEESMKHPVLMTEPALNPKANRERLTQIMFETFNVPSLYLANQSVMALHSYGISKGVAVRSGYETTETVAVYEGYLIHHASRCVRIGGKDIDEYLQRLMRDRGENFDTQSGKMILTDIKEKHGCFFQQDYNLDFEDLSAGNLWNLAAEKDKEAELGLMRTYELPDGRVIDIGKERFMAPEVMFKPQLLGMEAEGIHEMIISTVEDCDIGLRKDLYNTIYLAGGNTMIGGLKERLKNELESDETEISNKKQIKVKVKDDLMIDRKQEISRKYETWRGCSVHAAHRRFVEDRYISEDDYDEAGPGIVHRICF